MDADYDDFTPTPPARIVRRAVAIDRTGIIVSLLSSDGALDQRYYGPEWAAALDADVLRRAGWNVLDARTDGIPEVFRDALQKL